MYRPAFLAACLSLAGTAALAETVRINSQSDFLAIVQGKALTRLGIALEVTSDGRITGRAFGSPVSGAWVWRDGYFCRSLYHGERDLGDNCQMVELRGSRLRFTSDKGAGIHADLRLN